MSQNVETVMQALGVVTEKVDKNETVLSIKVDGRHKQPMGLVHGGVYVLLAESAASLAAFCWLDGTDEAVVGVEINANHVSSAKSGVVRATARCLHKGSRTMVYETYVETGDKKVLSISRCTLMRVNRSRN